MDLYTHVQTTLSPWAAVVPRDNDLVGTRLPEDRESETGVLHDAERMECCDTDDNHPLLAEGFRSCVPGRHRRWRGLHRIPPGRCSCRRTALQLALGHVGSQRLVWCGLDHGSNDRLGHRASRHLIDRSTTTAEPKDPGIAADTHRSHRRGRRHLWWNPPDMVWSTILTLNMGRTSSLWWRRENNIHEAAESDGLFLRELADL